MELLAPAGSLEAARSAVNNGADAIYVGGRVLNARRASPGFNREELAELVAYCRLRRVKVYVTVNTLVREDELPQLVELAEEVAASGADAAIVSDLGAARVLRQVCPTLPLHASTQMNIHTLSGVRFLEELGFRRVVLARELPLAEIAGICRGARAEIEVFAHGALCMSCSGCCLFSSVVGQKSGNRGLCAQPCRLPYEGDRYPLSLKDLCTLERLDALREAGVASLKIEGRLKSPEYVGSVSAAYRRVLDGAQPTGEEIERLAHIFSRGGFTDGYLTGRTGPEMFGTKTKTAYADYRRAVEEVTRTLKEGYEPKKRALRLALVLREDCCRLRVQCEDFTAEIEGKPPEPAYRREVTEEDALRALSKLGGTPFALESCTARVARDLFYSAADFNALRRSALEAVKAHFKPRPHPFSPTLAPVPGVYSVALHPTLEGWFWDPARLPREPGAHLARWWLNAAFPDRLQPTADDRAGVFFPAYIHERELERLANRLYMMGYRHALVRNPGHFRPLAEMGYTLHGDFGLNLANGQALQACGAHLVDVTVSPELTLRQIRALPKSLPVGLVVYGRLPLMETKNCLICNIGSCKKHGDALLHDRTGRAFPVFCGYDCQNTLFNSAPLYLADRNRAWQETGVSFGRLLFTDETAEEICAVIRAYREGARGTPENYTRGLYYRGVL